MQWTQKAAPAARARGRVAQRWPLVLLSLLLGAGCSDSEQSETPSARQTERPDAREEERKKSWSGLSHEDQTEVRAPYRGLFPSPPLFDRMPTYRTQGKRSLNFLSA